MPLKSIISITYFSNTRFVFGELSPAAAVLGGVLAQEIIKAVSHKDVPIRNHFFFNGASDRAGVVEAIGFWIPLIILFWLDALFLISFL